MKRQIIVIGGGASGLAAAITAAEAGARVFLLEQKDRVGKKILSTGNGKCNMTNRLQTADCYRSAEKSLPFQVIERFGWEETTAFFERMGIPFKERNGYVYPRSGQAASVLDALRFQCEAAGVITLCEKKVTEIRKTETGFAVLAGKERWQADAVILACGGKAAPVTGSDGNGYPLAKAFGHTMVPAVPALCALKSSCKGCKVLAGIRTDAKVSLYENGKLAAEDTGEVQLTAYGISGIPVFQVSRFAAYGLRERKKVECRLDFLPERSAEELLAYIEDQRKKRPDSRMAHLVPGLLPKNLWLQLCKEAGISPERTADTLKKQELMRLCGLAKCFVFPITETVGFEQAQVTAGGISLQEVDLSSMESKLQRGLYLTGELLDADGICGGYNLQWAWATGVLAGIHSAVGRCFEKGDKPCC